MARYLFRPRNRWSLGIVCALFAACVVTTKDYPLGRAGVDASSDVNAIGGSSGVGGSGGQGGYSNNGGVAGTPITGGTGGSTASAGSGGYAVGGGSGGTQGGAGADSGAEPQRKRVFVTSATYNGNLQAAGAGSDGLHGGDLLCATLANAAGLGGSWRAWLSTTSISARSRVTDVSPWYLVDRATLVFQTKAELSTVPHAAISMNERGEAVSSGQVWTGTRYGVATTARCSEWTYGSSGLLGAYGNVASISAWSYTNTSRCDSANRLYCFEQ